VTAHFISVRLSFSATTRRDRERPVTLRATPGVIRSKSLVVCVEGGLAKGERFGRTTHEKQQARQSAARDAGDRMLRTKRLFVYRQRAFAERPCPRKLALAAEEGGEGIEARRDVGMRGAERLSPSLSVRAQRPRNCGAEAKPVPSPNG
jgi:hypothetical protein